LDLSIIIPGYNEGQKIERDILEAAQFIAEKKYRAEILIINDGSTDSMYQVADKTDVPEGIDKKIISLDRNYGKGYAVRKGILESKGNIVMFCDTGSCTPYSCAEKGINLILNHECELAHGSRKLTESIIRRPQKFMRRVFSRLFNYFVVICMHIPGNLTDTQCGFKIYKGDVARELYTLCSTERFMFDIEVILLALKKGYKIIEFPIEWKNDYDTRVIPVQTFANVLKECFAIKNSLSKCHGH